MKRPKKTPTTATVEVVNPKVIITIRAEWSLNTGSEYFDIHEDRDIADSVEAALGSLRENGTADIISKKIVGTLAPTRKH